MPQSLIVAFRFLHVVSGAVWVGAVVLVAFFLMPAVMASGPAGGQVMKHFGERKYPQVMMALMAVTVLSGIGLMWEMASRSSGVWFSSPRGRTISFGAAATIVAGGGGIVVARPTAMRIQQLAGEIQTVIKPLGRMFSQINGIGGSTILGNGAVALILDVPALVRQVTLNEQHKLADARQDRKPAPAH